MWIPLVALMVVLAASKPEGKFADVDEIIIYAIPHSHTDAGWYWTYDSYFRTASQILSSLLDHLTTNPAHKFTWSDLSFF